MFWTLQIGIAAAAVAGFTAFGVACSSSSTDTGTDTDTDTGTDTDTSTDTETSTDTDTDTETDTDTSTSTDDACTCACTGTMAAGQCGNICSTLLNGATTMNLCEGAAALPQCAACLTMNCPSAAQTAGTCTGM